jgi:hypothetical protein
MKFVEDIEKLGWQSALAVVLVALGFVVGTSQELKNGLDLELPADQRALVGAVLTIVGVFFVVVGILEAKKESKGKASSEPEFSARKEAFRAVDARIKQHRALEEQDPEDFVSRLYLSAQRLRDKLHGLHVDKSVHPAGRELAYQLSMAAAGFLSDIEPIEIKSHVNLAKDDVMAIQLTEEDRQTYIRAVGRWREKSWALLNGAEIMLTTSA